MLSPNASKLSRRAPGLRAALRSGLAAATLLLGCQSLQNAVADGDTRTITMHHLHTKENITVTFKRNGRYDEAVLKKLNRFLRDWRHNTETQMDPRLIDLIWEVYREVEATQPIQIVGGYRDEQTNVMLRRRSNGVARNSLHMSGKAMDFAIPGVPLEKLRVAGLRLQRGGVGFYPTSGSPFVHMDVGGVRHWPRMTHEQLARVFPDGRTVHVPSDGKPLAGYALALADIERDGGSPSQVSLAAARDAGIDTEVTGTATPKRRNLLAAIFGPNEEDEAELPTSVSAPVRVAAAAPAFPAGRVPLPKTRPAAAPIVVAMALPEPRPAEATPNTAAVAGPERPPSTTVASVSPTPNEIIRSRGYWVGLPSMNPAASATVSVASAGANAGNPEITGSTPPEWHGLPGVRAFGDQRLAYAPQPERYAAIRPAPRPSVVTRSVKTASTIAAKATSGPMTPPLPAFNPWLTAMTITPSVRTYLSSTQYGVRDFRSLQPLLDKPATAVAMAFSSDPHQGLDTERFNGRAVVFLHTVTLAAHATGSLNRIASLR